MTDPYLIFDAPHNSMGMKSTKIINFQYFKDLFTQYVQWRLETNTGSNWFLNNSDLNITKTWDNIKKRWKFNLILDASYNGDYRFTFAVDLAVSEYVDKTAEHEYTLKIPIPNTTEFYEVVFNWSDIVSIPDLIISKGIFENKFWFRIRKNNINSGLHYELDPTFGYSEEHTVDYGAGGDTFFATKGTPTSSGTVDSITVFIDSGWTVNEKLKCVLYDSGINVIAITEERDEGGSGWQTFNFSEPKPSVTADTLYYIGLFSDLGYYIGYTNDDEASGTGGWYMENMTYPTPEDPIGSFDTVYTDYSLCIYATYTESGGGATGYMNCNSKYINGG